MKKTKAKGKKNKKSRLQPTNPVEAEVRLEAADNKATQVEPEAAAPYLAVPSLEEEVIFALDIGTRSVIGMVGYKQEDKLEIAALAIEEYQSRAVVDGQIEDIKETAKIAAKVKERLEAAIGRSLTKVYIAAAGRVLKTGLGEATGELPPGKVIDAPFVAKMEFAAVQKVYEDLMAKDENQRHTFLCVGHSTVAQALDDYELSTLIGHKGQKAALKVIATFLPKGVVDSLNSTMARIGLTVAGLTLEPIAAMNAVIPADLRKLNLALVDIGAGTADIALCAQGSVSAYTMATIAGDEVTEALMEKCLTDFATAEWLKTKLGSAEEITYTNILGLEANVIGEDLYQEAQPVIEELARVISEKIKEINERPPAAVFLVGGSSRLPQLPQLVAINLGIDGNKVAVGGGQNMKKMVAGSFDVFGPEFATPVGIALTAALGERDKSFYIRVNGEKISLPGGWEIKVLDALQLAGYRYSEIMGRQGQSLIYELNGERRSKRGEIPQPAVVRLNGPEASLGAAVAPGDELSFKAAVAGLDAAATLEELVGPLGQVDIMVNGIPYQAGAIAYVNDRQIKDNLEIKGLDNIIYKKIMTVEDLIKDIKLNRAIYEVFVNGKKELATYLLKSGDRIETPLIADREEIIPEEVYSEPEPVLVKPEPLPEPIPHPEPVPEPESYHELQPDKAGEEDIDIRSSDENITTPPEEPQGQQKQAAPRKPFTLKKEIGETEEAKTLDIILNGQPLTLEPKADGSPHVFVDVFSLVDLDTDQPQGTLVQAINGREAPYLQELKPGDELIIAWQEN